MDCEKIQIELRNHCLSALENLREKPMRVAVFCRAVEDGDAPDMAWRHYSAVISGYSSWTFIGCYAGQKSTDKTERLLGGLPQMIADCEQGKIDLIITKSVSAITRNLVELLNMLKKLQSMKPPIGIYFEQNNLYTSQDNTEILLSMLSRIAEQESENKSKRVGCIDFRGLNDMNILRTARKELGLTQQQVADKANINQRQYQMFESGTRDLINASFRIAMAVCESLEIEPEKLYRNAKYSISDYLCRKGSLPERKN